MNKQDRQNRTILKREREILAACLPRVLPLPAWLWEKEPHHAESGAGRALVHHTSRAQERSEGGMPRARGKQTSEFCTISLLNAGRKFSEQSWVLGGQTVWLTEAPNSRRGPAGAPGTWTHTPGGHRWLPISILQFCGKFSGLRSLCCWVLLGARCLLTEFLWGQEGTVGAATCALRQ